MSSHESLDSQRGVVLNLSRDQSETPLEAQELDRAHQTLNELGYTVLRSVLVRGDEAVHAFGAIEIDRGLESEDRSEIAKRTGLSRVSPERPFVFPEPNNDLPAAA